MKNKKTIIICIIILVILLIILINNMHINYYTLEHPLYSLSDSQIISTYKEYLEISSNLSVEKYYSSKYFKFRSLAYIEVSTASGKIEIGDANFYTKSNKLICDIDLWYPTNISIFTTDSNVKYFLVEIDKYITEFEINEYKYIGTYENVSNSSDI